MDAVLETTAWLDDFAASLQTYESSHTAASYLQSVRVFARFFEESNRQTFHPALLTTWDIRAFRSLTLDKLRRSPSTWNARRAGLAQFALWARAAGYISADVMEGVAAAERVTAAPRSLPPADFGRLMRQVERLVGQANTDLRRRLALRDGAMTALMVFAGLRVSEVADLRIEDVEIGARSGSVTIRRGKGGVLRQVPLSSDARRLLTAWLVERGDSDGALICDERNGRLTTRAMEKRLAEIGRLAGVEDLHPHRLRHTCVKRMIDAGRPLSDAQLVAGHKKIETTAHYAKASWEDLQEAVECVALGKLHRR